MQIHDSYSVYPKPPSADKLSPIARIDNLQRISKTTGKDAFEAIRPGGSTSDVLFGHDNTAHTNVGHNNTTAGGRHVDSPHLNMPHVNVA